MRGAAGFTLQNHCQTVAFFQSTYNAILQSRNQHHVIYELWPLIFYLFSGLGLSPEYLSARGLTELHPNSTLASSEFPFSLDGEIYLFKAFSTEIFVSLTNI